MHDHLRERVGDLLVERFQNSHDIEVIYSVDREIADFPTDVELDDGLKSAAMDEGRGCQMSWLWMQSRI